MTIALESIVFTDRYNGQKAFGISSKYAMLTNSLLVAECCLRNGIPLGTFFLNNLDSFELNLGVLKKKPVEKPLT